MYWLHILTRGLRQDTGHIWMETPNTNHTNNKTQYVWGHRARSEGVWYPLDWAYFVPRPCGPMRPSDQLVGVLRTKSGRGLYPSGNGILYPLGWIYLSGLHYRMLPPRVLCGSWLPLAAVPVPIRPPSFGCVFPVQYGVLFPVPSVSILVFRYVYLWYQPTKIWYLRICQRVLLPLGMPTYGVYAPKVLGTNGNAALRGCAYGILFCTSCHYITFPVLYLSTPRQG